MLYHWSSAFWLHGHKLPFLWTIAKLVHIQLNSVHNCSQLVLISYVCCLFKIQGTVLYIQFVYSPQLYSFLSGKSHVGCSCSLFKRGLIHSTWFYISLITPQLYLLWSFVWTLLFWVAVTLFCHTQFFNVILFKKLQGSTSALLLRFNIEVSVF